MVAVNPTPRLSSSHKPTAICSGDIFNYTPTSATIGATYAWTRSYVPGIDLVAGGGTDNPDEQLINTTYDNVNVLYVYTVTINGCSFSPDSVTILVHPTPTLSSPLKATVCSGTPLVYTPSSYTPVPQVTYTWARAAVAGLTPSVGSGSGSITGTATTGKITETLTNSTTSTINTQYAIILKVDGVCPNLQTVAVAVNPAPAAPKIAIMPIDSSLCLNTNYQNFGAATAPPAGTTYIWSAINGQVWATSANKQNSIVTFDKSGTASVIVTSSIGSTACKNSDTVSYHVGTTSSDEPRVILFNGQFMCLENGMTSYQWGYDDATTLDSTAIQGEVNQVYFNNSPDLLHKYYWLMSTNNGCRQKTYYNLPTGITNVNAGELAGIKVYPNPANDNINVEINSGVGGDMQVEVLNLLGQKLNATVATDNKATISVAGLPAGCYLVNCYREGVKIGTAKFIKN